MEFWKANRKFMALLIFEFATISALFTGDLTGPEFVALTPWILGVFSAANVAEKFVKKVDQNV